MNKNGPKELGNTLWKIADDLHDAMNVAMIMKFSTHCVENSEEVCV